MNWFKWLTFGSVDRDHFLVGAAAVTYACGYIGSVPNHYNVVIDASMSHDDVANVSVALAEWTAKTGVKFNVDETKRPWAHFGQTNTIYFSAVSQAMIDTTCSDAAQHAIKVRTHLLGCTNRLPGSEKDVYVKPNSDIRALLHETGHALGLDHDGPGTIMYKYVDDKHPVYSVTQADIDQYWALRIFDL